MHTTIYQNVNHAVNVEDDMFMTDRGDLILFEDGNRRVGVQAPQVRAIKKQIMRGKAGVEISPGMDLPREAIATIMVDMIDKP